MTQLLEDREPAPASLEGHAVSGAVWVTAEMAGVQGTSFIVFATIAHFVRPRDFGLIGICYFAVQSLEMLVLYNVATVAFRRRQAIAREFTTAFWITIGLAVLLFLGLVAVSNGAELVFHAPGLAPILRAMSVILLFMGLSRTHEAWMIRHFQFKSMVIRGIAGAVIGGITGVILAINGFGVDALVAQQIVTSLISTTLLWLVCPWRPDFRISAAAAREIMVFMFRMLPNNLVSALNQNCDTFLVAFFFGPAGVGFYNVGKRVKLALQLVAGNPISAIGLPTLAEIQDDPARLRAGVLRSITMICAICGPIFLGASAVAQVAVVVLFGEYWAQSIPVMQLLCLGGLAMVMMSFDDNVFILKDRPVWCLWVSLSYASLAVAALLVLARLKMESLALPFVLPYVFVLPLSLTLMSKRLGLAMRDVIAAILPGLSSAAVMFAVVQWAGGHLPQYPDLIRLGLLCGIGMLTYIAILFCAWRETARQIFSILKHLRARRMTEEDVLL